MMKRILYIALLAVAALATAGCDDQEDMFTKQQEGIVRYLTSTRRLIAEEEVGNVIEDNPAFYTAYGRELYRHIPTYYNEGRDALVEVVPGSRITIDFDAFVFDNSEPSLSSCYWSNTAKTIGTLEASNPHAKLDWEVAPLALTVGETSMIEGLREALVGCREQDSVQIYMTYKKAYGKKLVGTVPKYSAVAWYIKILSVEQ